MVALIEPGNTSGEKPIAFAGIFGCRDTEKTTAVHMLLDVSHTHWVLARETFCVLRGDIQASPFIRYYKFRMLERRQGKERKSTARVGWCIGHLREVTLVSCRTT